MNDALIQPLAAMAGVTAVLWATMVGTRYYAILRRVAPVSYYVGYGGQAPPEWVERPARAFMNSLEVPVLFYLLGVLMLITQSFDALQVTLAWVFVAIRIAHAVIHVGINRVQYRFVAYVSGTLTLIVMWARFLIAHF